MKKVLCFLFCYLLGTAAYAQDGITDKGYISTSSELFSEDGVLFTIDNSNVYRKHRVLIKYPQSKNASTYTVPDWVYTIANGAFKGNNYIETIRIPSSIGYIGENAFTDCSSLKSIEIYETTSGVRAVENNDSQSEVKEVGRYNIQGVKIEEGMDGQVQIILFSDGSAKKVIE